jgi:hypothetical protein
MISMSSIVIIIAHSTVIIVTYIREIKNFEVDSSTIQTYAGMGLVV